MRKVRILPCVCLLLLGIPLIIAPGQGEAPPSPRPAQAAVITCTGMIDDGLYQSIRRRTEEAVEAGADYLIYDIDTYGGRVDAADNIAEYLIMEVAPRARTVAYVSRKAISAGALISVSCNDIIMAAHTTIGDSAPIAFQGQPLEGVEREKAETYIRAIFQRAAEANDYPVPLVLAMVTMGIEVYQVQNLETGEFEFFQDIELPTDTDVWDIGNRRLIVSSNQILTLTAAQALDFGIARAVVTGRREAINFLEQRDNVAFQEDVPVFLTNWSEELVRWLNSPTVAAILFMIGVLGIYIELNTPGLGLPAMVAAVAFAILFGSKYLIGLAGYVEIAVFVLGVVLLALEIFVIPGFGVAGILGILCIVFALVAMFVPAGPGEVPWPRVDFEWELLIEGLVSLAAGFVGFLILAWLAGKYMPRMKTLSGLILQAPQVSPESAVSMTWPPEEAGQNLSPGDEGVTLTLLRPAGKARFGSAVVDVVAQGAYISKGTAVRIVEIRGNRVVVKAEHEGKTGKG